MKKEAYNKVKATIYSCKTIRHIINTRKLLNLYEVMYKDQKSYKELYRLHLIKREEIYLKLFKDIRL